MASSNPNPHTLVVFFTKCIEMLLHKQSCLTLVLMIAVAMLSLFLMWVSSKRKNHVYLLDYACVKYPDDQAKITSEVVSYFLPGMENVRMKDVLFQFKVFMKSGIGEEAYVPRVNLAKSPTLLTQQDMHDQAHILVVGAVESLLKSTCLDPSLIDIVIVNSGMFNPTPSLASILVHRFGMRTDVKSFHLSGMGCSASLISLDLARNLLVDSRTLSGFVRNLLGDSSRPGSRPRYALIASTECMSSFYNGHDRRMMLANVLFRAAGNAFLLSNRPQDKPRSKMELLHLVRVNTASRDEAYNAVMVQEDEENIFGAQLSPQLIDVATHAIKENVKKLAPKVLPLSELWKVGVSEVKRKVFKMKHVKSYVPNFKLAFDHFCIHPGSKAVIEGVGKSLGLSGYDLEPSLMALHRFGNTSCSGIWYELAYCEAKKRLKEGDKVWQLGLGSGFKCNSAVWRVLRPLNHEPLVEFCNPWADCIGRYPISKDLSSLPHVIQTLAMLQKLHDLHSTSNETPTTNT